MPPLRGSEFCNAVNPALTRRATAMPPAPRARRAFLRSLTLCQLTTDGRFLKPPFRASRSSLVIRGVLSLH